MMGGVLAKSEQIGIERKTPYFVYYFNANNSFCNRSTQACDTIDHYLRGTVNDTERELRN